MTVGFTAALTIVAIFLGIGMVVGMHSVNRKAESKLASLARRVGPRGPSVGP
jgi:uncharacterized membrane protein YeiB